MGLNVTVAELREGCGGVGGGVSSKSFHLVTGRGEGIETWFAVFSFFGVFGTAGGL